MANRHRAGFHLLVEPVPWCDTVPPGIRNAASALPTTRDWNYPGRPADETAKVLTTGCIVAAAQ
jgi:hypothetical protein